MDDPHPRSILREHPWKEDTVNAKTVPNFVPTTKLHRVLRSDEPSLESLAGPAIFGAPSQFVTLGASRWFLVRPVLGRRGS